MQLLLATILLGGAVGFLSGTVAAAASIGVHDVAASGILAFDFDIPAQPLQSAIERYSEITGLSVLYLGTLAIGRTSVPLKGRHAPEAALEQLIADAGLVIRHSSADSFSLARASREDLDRLARARQAQAREAAVRQAYFGSIQQGFRAVLCRDARVAPDDFRAALQVWVDLHGRIFKVNLLATTGDKARDAAIVQALLQTDVAPPPAHLQQPMTMLILPRAQALTVDCDVG